MPHAAMLPALSLLAGIVAGVVLPSVDPGAAGLILIVAWTGAVAAHLRGVDRAVRPAAAVAFAVCGLLLSARALDAALHPSLRHVLDAAQVLDDRQDGDVVVLEGRLRSDAAPGPAGVRLSLDIARVSVGDQTEEVDGGVLLGVSGDLAPLASTEWTAGRVIRVPALVRRPARYLDPGVPDQEVSLARRGTALVGTAKSAAVVEVVARGRWWDERAADIRAWTRRAIAAHVGVWSPRSAAIVTALLIGDRAGLDDEVERRLQEAGTYHVIAISGGNIALLAGAMAGLLVLLRITDRRAAIVPIAALLVYAFIVGGGASVVRATAMAVVYLAARIGDHRSPPLNALGVAAVVILSVTPLAVFDAGFALTFGATLAILVGARAVVDRLASEDRSPVPGSPIPMPGSPSPTPEARIPMSGARRPVPGARLPSRRWLRAAAALFAASVCAELALFPVAAFVFSRVTFAGLLLNFAAIPLMALAQLAGLLTLVAAALSATVARAAGFVAHLGAAGVIGSARAVDFAPWLTYRVPPPAVSVMIVYYLAVAACVVGRRRRIAAGVAAVAALWILAAPASLARARSTGTLDVTFFDVGQGDSTLVRFPNGRTLLVDAGGVSLTGGFDIGARVLAPALWASGIRRLTYLAVTHGDPDHIGGASSVVRDFSPLEIWYGTPVPPHEPTRRLITDATAVGAAWRTLLRGDELDLAGVHLRVWHPGPPDWERQRVRNDDSIVMELTFGEASVVLTGDIGREVEGEIGAQLAPSPLRAVKVAHHGSGTSSAPEFLAAAKPAVAVVSCGRGNRYGHPVPYVVDRYKAIGAAMFRTDQDGAVTIRTDGRSLDVTTFTGRSWRVSR